MVRLESRRPLLSIWYVLICEQVLGFWRKGQGSPTSAQMRALVRAPETSTNGQLKEVESKKGKLQQPATKKGAMAPPALFMFAIFATCRAFLGVRIVRIALFSCSAISAIRRLFMFDYLGHLSRFVACYCLYSPAYQVVLGSFKTTRRPLFWCEVHRGCRASSGLFDSF
jgi:hypothetical protein